MDRELVGLSPGSGLAMVEPALWPCQKQLCQQGKALAPGHHGTSVARAESAQGLQKQGLGGVRLEICPKLSWCRESGPD